MSNADIPLDIEDQVSLMKSYVTFRQKLRMKRLLQKEGYFRVSRYGKYLLSFTQVLQAKPTQDLLYDLYDFDIALREIFFRYTQKAEIQIKNHIANACSLYTQNPTFYLDQTFYTPSGGVSDKTKRKANVRRFPRVFSSIKEAEKALIKHQNKHPQFSSYRTGGPRYRKRIPAWAAFMYFDFGTVENIYAYSKMDLRKEVLRYGYPDSNRKFGKNDTYNMDTWISAIRNLRNTCSHHNILVGKTSSVVHLDHKVDSPQCLPSDTDLFSRMYALKKILHPNDSAELKIDLQRLLSRTKINVYQFNVLPQNWESLYDSIHNL
ncbi:Abi family protein [Domibacillus sp. DTU_2020_1001157_1_SI_ALB_TIR_016]|uniref:Abi family protein n=1 Tax=Domibacillus sp. DTU_2020_1001157_1_SI_ALB_TIR_016 TaxID=3077789 RepID=UPI0028E3273C|nr:Abi family protein [Domibacillus sp. DTU_2020_1001157_1_SI_ALB_TIR_016]WNS78816.1 Abi family protein [Domibacillus sp. DTU_2020_1001157_1_SI_ALB_TIR_016]